MSLEGVQRSRGVDSEWQIVPYTCCSNSKCSMVDGAESCTWHYQLVGDWWSQTVLGVVVQWYSYVQHVIRCLMLVSCYMVKSIEVLASEKWCTLAGQLKVWCPTAKPSSMLYVWKDKQLS